MWAVTPAAVFIMVLSIKTAEYLNSPAGEQGCPSHAHPCAHQLNTFPLRTFLFNFRGFFLFFPGSDDKPRQFRQNLIIA